MLSFAAFAEQAPELAAAARRLLVGEDGNAIGFLASAAPDGVPHLAPVCPIFCGAELCLSASARSPKARDLRENGRYVLHAFLGPDDEELQLRGVATEVTEPDERAAIHEAIPFAAFEVSDPLFRLWIGSALWVHWERVGQPDTRAVRRRWPEAD